MSHKIIARSIFRGREVRLVLAKNEEGTKRFIWSASNGLPMACGNGLFFESIQDAINCARSCGAVITNYTQGV